MLELSPRTSRNPNMGLVSRGENEDNNNNKKNTLFMIEKVYVMF